jgi:hypothetical protein
MELEDFAYTTFHHKPNNTEILVYCGVKYKSESEIDNLFAGIIHTLVVHIIKNDYPEGINVNNWVKFEKVPNTDKDHVMYRQYFNDPTFDNFITYKLEDESFRMLSNNDIN